MLNLDPKLQYELSNLAFNLGDLKKNVTLGKQTKKYGACDFKNW